MGINHDLLLSSQTEVNKQLLITVLLAEPETLELPLRLKQYRLVNLSLLLEKFLNYSYGA